MAGASSLDAGIPSAAVSVDDMAVVPSLPATAAPADVLLAAPAPSNGDDVRPADDLPPPDSSDVLGSSAQLPPLHPSANGGPPGAPSPMPACTAAQPPLGLASESLIGTASATPHSITTTAAPAMTPALSFASHPASPLSAAATPAVMASAVSTGLPTPASLASSPASAPFFIPIRSAENPGSTSGAAPSGPRAVKTSAKAEKLACSPASVSRTRKPLTLLEMPVDVLRLIVKEIHHTNDLTALALANSTLYSLAVPHIYSRFDIIWPDPSIPPVDGKSVDALTYGLSTLCLGSAFARTMHRLRADLYRGSPSPAADFLARNRFGATDYAKYTRKFSLGNGPSDWVAEYMINKESGKMLGTLVALCVAKMANLENFVWDMPTGVISDVFMALASLPDHNPEHHQCKLDRLWIRWHDNAATSPPHPPPGPSVTSPPLLQHQPFLLGPANTAISALSLQPPSVPLGAPAPRTRVPYSSSRVEFPTFSVVPPVRSLTVLDIDELAYLDEMAVLIERSKDRLTELRVGIAQRVCDKEFVQQHWDPANLQQVDLDARWPGESAIGDKRLGGVLGVLVGRICDIRRKTSQSASAAASALNGIMGTNGTTNADPSLPSGLGTSSIPGAAANISNEASPMPAAAALAAAPATAQNLPPTFTSPGQNSIYTTAGNPTHVRPALDHKLKLTTLELERVPLSMPVCNRAFDWTTITSLTLLSCPQNEVLWKQLKRHYAPTVEPDHSCAFSSPSAKRPSVSSATPRYQLSLKHLHTDVVSKPLLSFIRDTLAPNSLEVLFLQNRRRTDVTGQISVTDIFRNAIKPHRSSLQKLLIDCSWKSGRGSHAHHNHNEAELERLWVLTRSMVDYVTSGRMVNLRELSVSLNYSDWHYFLQRLANLPQLHSIHIAHIANMPRPPRIEPFEQAMQVANIAALRPEIQLCFVAIADKCFEIVEWTPTETISSSGSGGVVPASNFVFPHGGTAMVHDDNAGSIAGGSEDTSESEDDDDDDDDDNDDDDDGDESNDGNDADSVAGMVGMIAAQGHDNGDSDAEDSDGAESDADSFVEAPMSALRVREIFFYDDKVAIFKARRARL